MKPDYEIIIYHIEASPLNPENDNVDVEVIFKNGDRYAASVFTLSNIKEIMERHKSTGENMSGRYFNTPDMIIVDKLDVQTIHDVTEYTIQKNEFHWRFRKLEEDEDDD